MNKYKYKNMMFFAPDEGGGGGEGDGAAAGLATGGGAELTRGAEVFEPVTKTTTGDRVLPEKKPTEKVASAGPSGAGTEKTPDEQTPPVFDPAKYAKEFGDAIGTQLKPLLEQRSVEPEKKMTPEEARKFLNIWEPDEAWYKNYDNLETRKAAIEQMRDGLALQADTLNQLRMNEALTKLREEIMPGLKTVSETAEAQREERLHTQYPTLKNPALKPLIDAIAQDFIKQKKTFPNEGELFKALATGVEAVLKVNNPEFKLEVATNGNGQQKESADRGGRQLPVTTPGGGGGTGRKEGSDKTAKPRGLAIFD